MTEDENKVPGVRKKPPLKKAASFLFWCLAGIIVLLVAMAAPGFYYARSRAAFNVCNENLGHVKYGLDEYLSAGNSLKGVGKYADEVCHLVLIGYPKYDDPYKCAGKLKKHIDSACDDFSVRIVGDKQYEITGKAQDARGCCIIITEREWRPEGFEPDCPGPCPAAKH